MGSFTSYNVAKTVYLFCTTKIAKHLEVAVIMPTLYLLKDSIRTNDASY